MFGKIKTAINAIRWYVDKRLFRRNTVILSAKDSMWIEKMLADVRCDGTTDAEKINGVIRSSKESICIRMGSGTYTLDAPIVTDAEHGALMIIGNGTPRATRLTWPRDD